MKGACACGNIELHWQLVDLSLVPRACDCDYCSGHGISWVSKSGTRLRAVVHNPLYYRIVQQGSGTADFHECTHCRMPVFASARIDGQDYAVVNAGCLANPQGFGEALPVSFTDESTDQRAQRRARNWCSLTRLTVGG
jgi:hypothetical protein